MRWPALLALALLALAACAEPPPPSFGRNAAAAPPVPVSATPPRPPMRMAPTLSEPLSLVRTTPGDDRAPMPNRDIEAPRQRGADSLDPTLEPMLLPPERRQGATFGGEHLRETGPDRPLDNFVPGARLRIPFEGTPPR